MGIWGPVKADRGESPVKGAIRPGFLPVGAQLPGPREPIQDEPPSGGFSALPAYGATGRDPNVGSRSQIDREPTPSDMPRDAQGPDSPFGDNAEFQDPSSAEDFLGLDAPSADSELNLTELEADEGPGLDQPSPEELQTLGTLESAEPSEPSELQLAAVPDPLAEFASQEPDLDLEEDLEEDSASWLMEFDLSDAGDESEEAFADALQGSDEFGADGEQSASNSRTPWIGRALIAVISVAAGVVGSKYMSQRQNPAETPAGTTVAEVAQVQEPAQPASNANVGPVDPAPQTTATPPTTVASSGNEPAVAPTEVAQTNTPQPTKSGSRRPSRSNPQSTKPRGIARVRGGRWEAVRKTGDAGKPFEVAVAQSPASAEPIVQPEQLPPTAPAQPGGATAGEPLVVVDMQGPAGGGQRRAQSAPIVETLTQPVETEGGLRQASAAELANIWQGSSIPVEAIAGSKRLLTPAVGRVRVVLASGEVFEGKLYAVGSRKVWIETKLGKMALLDYQIDRVEHIVNADGDALTGGDSHADLAGLQGVRVRTAGGVFYGKLLSRDGATVTIVTDSGARITLQDAHVEAAGKTATQLVDSSGATARVDGNE